MSPLCQECGKRDDLIYWLHGRYVCFGCRLVLLAVREAV